MSEEIQSTPKTPKESLKKALPLIYLVTALFALRWTVVEPYVVPTGSMEPTLKKGDRLYASKFAYDFRFPFTNWTLFKTGEIKRGDVILFVPPIDASKTYVKRAIGLPGDRIEVRRSELYINGELVQRQPAPNRNVLYDVDPDETSHLFIEQLGDVRHYMLLKKSPDPYNAMIYRGRNSAEVTVPPNMVFAMGDNRDESFDSRYWGFVPMDQMKGKGIFIWYSSRPIPTGMGVVMDTIAGWFDPRPERVGTLIP